MPDSEENRLSRRPKKPPREAYNIQFAQHLPTEELLVLLQYELLRARDRKQDVSLPTAIVHDIKFRLGYYLDNYGEVERPPPKRAGQKDDDRSR
jgi:hypothetical protein